METSTESIVKRFMPAFHICSSEKHHSMNVSQYVGYCAESEDGRYLTLVDKSCKNGVRDCLQVFANVIELNDESGAPVVDVVYYVFFPYNGNIGIANKGEHWYDMEHVTIRFNCARCDMTCGSIPHKIMYSIHSKYRWFDWSAPEVTKDSYNAQKVHVYVAKGSHACYPKPGTYWRYMGFANDKCDAGYVPQCVHLTLYNAEDKLFKYASVLGPDDTHNFNKWELQYGEIPSRSSYKNSITSYMWT